MSSSWESSVFNIIFHLKYIYIIICFKKSFNDFLPIFPEDKAAPSFAIEMTDKALSWDCEEKFSKIKIISDNLLTSSI